MALEQNPRPLTSYKILSFDVYATLIDWETGILTALAPLRARLPPAPPPSSSSPNQTITDRHLLTLFTRHEGEIQSQNPTLKYSEVLSAVYLRIAEELHLPQPHDVSILEEEATTFGSSVGSWPLFPDVLPALTSLKKRYKLVVLSNVDSVSFAETIKGPFQGQKDLFDAVYTAEEIGSYKPDPRNFEYMVKKAGEDGLGEGKKSDFLHTAQALWHDHVPAKKVGLDSCWIERGGDEAAMGGKLGDFGEGDVRIAWRFRTLGEMAEAVERAFEEGEEQGK